MHRACASFVTTAAAALALLAPAAASGATNTFSMRAEIALSGPPGSPSPTIPARLGYRWITHADTDPPGSQPDTISTLTIAIPRATSNARYFPSCTQAEIDGRQSFPDSCRPAIVGYGNASAYAGSPGGP